MKNDPEDGKNVDNPPQKPVLSLNFKGPVGLIGGGDLDPDALDLLRNRVIFFVAADGGGDVLVENGVIPDAVVGDLDSLSDAARAAIPAGRIHRIAEQDSTDFDKALSAIEAPLILAAGFSGARLDHELAALNGLVKRPDRRAIIVGRQEAIVHVPARITLELPPCSRLSLFPMDAVRVRTEGLEWSFESIDLHPARRIGTSNAVRDGRVDIQTDRPGLLLIVPREGLDAVISALEEADFHSPPG